uniref:Mitochondrial carrier protein n=2 Tax=Octactis speculum TaxID=3111310 RepID=A0A7S2H2A9_9STRA|mmetsp:Transcript_60629/g.83220  ORF Transcript_60629/g.83220 Transcript_60629/m.83220 type:complete len:352 (+) Transcript_60629:48-1103(+)
MDNLIAGSVARIVAQTVLHPLDVIRTRRQAVGVDMRWNIPTLLRGITPQTVLSAPAGALQFLTMEKTKRFLNKWGNGTHSPKRMVATNLVAMAIGTSAASAVRVPQEVLKQGIQAGNYDNIIHAVRAHMGPGGLRRLYRGFKPTIIRDVPWNSLSYVFFKALAGLAALIDKEGRLADSNSFNLFLGAISGGIAAVLTHPIDVIKTRIMTARVTAEYVAPPSIIGGLRAMVAKEGPGVLFLGIVPRLMFLCPLAAMVLATYEAVLARIAQRKYRMKCGGEAERSEIEVTTDDTITVDSGEDDGRPSEKAKSGESDSDVEGDSISAVAKDDGRPTEVAKSDEGEGETDDTESV